MALNSLYCADVPLSNYSLTHCSLSYPAFVFSVFSVVHYRATQVSGPWSPFRFMMSEANVSIQQAVREGATICPRPLKVDLLTLKVVSESRVTSASLPLCQF